MASHLRMVLLLACIASLVTASVAHTATTLSPALSAYAEGLDSMMAAKWQKSIQTFSRTLETAEANADYSIVSKQRRLHHAR